MLPRMAGREPSLYKTNWNKFEEAVNDVVRKEVCRVFLWLYQGGPKYVGQYLDEIPGGKAGLNKDEKATLTGRKPPSKMDITLLYRLLQRTCGLAETSDPIWVSPPDPNSRSLEYTLYLIKEERNTMAHEGHTREARHMSEADLDRKLRRLRGLCADLLLEASRRCGRESQADGLIKNMEDRLQNIQGVTADRFVLMAREERLKTVRTKMVDVWYQQPLLRLHSRDVGLDDLLPRQAADGAAPGCLLVSGEAGVGKSSLCRLMQGEGGTPKRPQFTGDLSRANIIKSKTGGILDGSSTLQQTGVVVGHPTAAAHAHVSSCKDSRLNGDDPVCSRSEIKSSPPEYILHTSQQPHPILDQVLSRTGRNLCVIIYNYARMTFQTKEETASVEESRRGTSRTSSRSQRRDQERNPRILNRKYSLYKDLPCAKVNVPSTSLPPPPSPMSKTHDISPPSTL